MINCRVYSYVLAFNGKGGFNFWLAAQQGMLINPLLLTRKCPVIFLSCCYHPTLLILLLITMNFTTPTHYFISCASSHLLSHLNYQNILYFSICDKIIWYSLSHFSLLSPNLILINGTMISNYFSPNRLSSHSVLKMSCRTIYTQWSDTVPNMTYWNMSSKRQCYARYLQLMFDIQERQSKFSLL